MGDCWILATNVKGIAQKTAALSVRPAISNL